MSDPTNGQDRLTVYVVPNAETVARLAGAPGSGILGFWTSRASGAVAFANSEPKRTKYDLDGQSVFFHEYMHHLMLEDATNPRSVRYQLDRIVADLQAVPSASSAPRPLRLAEELITRLEAVDAIELGRADQPALAEFLDQMYAGLRALSGALTDHYLQQPLEPRPLVPIGSRGGAR